MRNQNLPGLCRPCVVKLVVKLLEDRDTRLALARERLVRDFLDNLRDVFTKKTKATEALEETVAQIEEQVDSIERSTLRKFAEDQAMPFGTSLFDRKRPASVRWLSGFRSAPTGAPATPVSASPTRRKGPLWPHARTALVRTRTASGFDTPALPMQRLWRAARPP